MRLLKRCLSAMSVRADLFPGPVRPSQTPLALNAVHIYITRYPSGQGPGLSETLREHFTSRLKQSLEY